MNNEWVVDGHVAPDDATHGCRTVNMIEWGKCVDGVWYYWTPDGKLVECAGQSDVNFTRDDTFQRPKLTPSVTIGRFIYTGTYGHQPFEVATRVRCNGIDEHDGRSGWKGKKIDGSGYYVYDYCWRFEPAEPDRIAAHQFLERGAQHLRDRAASRDAPDGERSMARCVAAFNAQEGTNLTEVQGWRFMIQLKYARSIHGSFNPDDYEDLAAYAGLAGEAAQ